jgi:uncharacterized protein involved in exopolysaccharide biosynthesis
MNASVTVQLVKGSLMLGVLVLPVACATTDQLETVRKEISNKVVASQAEQRENTATQVQKTQEDLEARIDTVRAEVVQKTEAQEKQLTTQMEDLRREFGEVRERVRQLNQIEADVREIQIQTRYIQTGFKDNLRGQASLLREELEMIEKTLKEMEPQAEKSP